MNSSEVIEYRDVFCPVCGTFFDLRQVGTEYQCRKCLTKKNCLKSTYDHDMDQSAIAGNRMMFTRSIVEFPSASAWLNKTLASKGLSGPSNMSKKEDADSDSDDGIGAQRALVSEECQKCKNPKMFFWTQQLRSADEGQTVFYECPNCGHRLSINS